MGDLGEPSTGQAAECCGLRVLAVSSPLVTAPLEGGTSRHPCRVCSWDLEGSGCRAAPLASPLINMQQKMQDEKRTRSNSLLLSSPFLTLILPAHKPRATKWDIHCYWNKKKLGLRPTSSKKKIIKSYITTKDPACLLQILLEMMGQNNQPKYASCKTSLFLWRCRFFSVFVFITHELPNLIS